MKLIEHIHIDSDIDTAALRLRNQGIKASSTNESVNFPRYSMAAKNIKRGVWIHIDHQYDDALNYLRNPQYEITTGLSEEELARLEDSANIYLNKLVNYFLIGVGILVVAIVMFIYMQPGV